MSRKESGMELYGYCPCKKCCGPNFNGVTVCGKKLTKEDEFKLCAAPKIFKCGIKLKIPCLNRDLVVMDRCVDTTGKKIGIFFWTHDSAMRFGRKKCQISY